MIKPIDETIDYLCTLIRAYWTNNIAYNEGDALRNMLEDIDVMDGFKSYADLGKRQGVWFYLISRGRSWQTDYIVEAFVRHKIATPEDILHVCNAMNIDRYSIRPDGLLKGIDIIAKRQHAIGDDDLLNILDI